jgi:hypothetical protein
MQAPLHLVRTDGRTAVYIRGEVFADLGAGVPKVKTQRTCPSIKMVIEPRTYTIGRYRKGRVE